MGILSGAFNSIQKWLLPVLEDEIGELTGKQKEFIRVVEEIDLEKYLWEFRWNGVGRKWKKRFILSQRKVKGDFRAFICTAGGYGTMGIRKGKPFLEVKNGKIEVRHIVY